MTIRNLDALFHPSAVWFVGVAQTAAQRALCARLQRADAFEFRHLTDLVPDAAAATGALAAVIAESRFANAATLEWLGQRGCRGVLWPIDEPPSAEVMAAARARTIRILGPRSVGLATPSIGLDLTLFAQTPAPGSIALIVQSQSVAAAAVDWASGRGIGFSMVAVVGGEADVDIADLLDFAALDRHTSAVAVELGRIRGGRKFMSAARACARTRPTVILQTRSADAAQVGADPVRSAAFARAGMVEVPTLPGLFDALAALERLPGAEHGRVLVAANGGALCGLAVDAVLRQKLSVADVSAAAREAIGVAVPKARFLPGAVDLGDPPLPDLVDALRILLEAPQTDAVIYVRSPGAAMAHEDVARALAESLPGSRLLTVWLGLESALAARRRSAAAHQPTFTSPDAAARAIRYRYEYAHNRVLLTQTPPRLSPAAFDRRQVTALLAQDLDGAAAVARPATVQNVATAYGISLEADSARHALNLDCRIARHPELGLHLRVAPQARGVHITAAAAFPPLDPLLADRMLEAAGLLPETGVSMPDRLAAGDTLIRMAQLAMDQPSIAGVHARLTVADGQAELVGEPVVELCADPPPPRERLSLAPYPVEQERNARLASGKPVFIRAIRPTDEEDVVRLLESLDTESVRLRFFIYIRHFSHAMAARMTQIDYDRELGLIASTGDAPGRAIGLATLVSDPDGNEAEFAVLVHQACAGEGLGRLLMEQLVEHARATGVRRVVGDVLQENGAMLRLATRLGFTSRRHPDEVGCLRVELDLG